MRREVARLLESLAAVYPKKTLLALWSDIRGLSKKDFEAALASASKDAGATTPTGRRRRPTPSAELPDDSPEGRIGHILLVSCGFSEDRATKEMHSQLLHQGVAPVKIPPFEQDSFRDWLRVLFRSVPAGRVMHGALQIEERRRPRDVS